MAPGVGRATSKKKLSLESLLPLPHANTSHSPTCVHTINPTQNGIALDAESGRVGEEERDRKHCDSPSQIPNTHSILSLPYVHSSVAESLHTIFGIENV